MRLAVTIAAWCAKVATAMSVPNDVNVLGYPSFDVPSFPLNGLTLATKHTMASALETTGMISLREVPGFQAARRRYLQAAADCATSNPVDFDQLLSKTLMDGTIRRTLSINMNGVHDAIADRCPEFATSHAQYTTVVNHATAKFAAALDSINDDLTADHLLPIVHEGHHLDHFHAYSNTGSETSKTETSAPLSLELHADAGLMIIMAKPLFFARAEGGVRSVENPNEKQAGLVIQVDGNLVRPDLKDDELYLMVGEGLRLWGNFGFHFHPVVHGMVMPKEADASVVRAFAGRMLLLPSTKKMTNTGLTFGAYLNATTRYLKHESGVESAMSLACPVGRVLQASDESCTLGLWEPDEGSTATKEQCMRQCNIWGHPSDAKKCVAMKCKKVGEVPGGGNDCWMMCLPHLTPDQCPPPGEETCNSPIRQLYCKIPTTTPAPTTPKPTPSPTPEPTTTTTTPAPNTTTPAPTTTTPAPTTTMPAPTTTTPKPTNSPTPAPTTTTPAPTTTTAAPTTATPAPTTTTPAPTTTTPAPTTTTPKPTNSPTPAPTTTTPAPTTTTPAPTTTKPKPTPSPTPAPSTATPKPTPCTAPKPTPTSTSAPTTTRPAC